MIGTFTHDADVLLGAIALRAVVVPGPFITNLVARNRRFKRGINRIATRGSFRHFPGSALGQQGRWCQKLKFEMIKRVSPFNQTQLEGTQHFIME